MSAATIGVPAGYPDIEIADPPATTPPATLTDLGPGSLSAINDSGVAVGSYHVRLELAGHRAWSTSVTVASGARARISASLEP